MIDPPVQHFEAPDGTSLAYREIGDGRPLVLLHGFISTAELNWLRWGTAQAIAERGHRVVLPDLRAHGDSEAPRDPASYPPDVLADDAFALLEHLGLDDYDLGGYSLGGRTVIRLLVRGASPRRAVVAGMGLDGVLDVERSNAKFSRVFENLGTFERKSPEWLIEAFLRQNGGDPEAMILALRSSVPTSVDELSRIVTPTLVVVGEDDVEHTSADELAEVLPHGRFATVTGNHLSAGTKPDLAQVIGDFLDEPDPV
ncbi:MAG TPA: alpha/beta hydrolase [Acidimicrobiales bacterium]